jgi:hypothetical protein
MASRVQLFIITSFVVNIILSLFLCVEQNKAENKINKIQDDLTPLWYLAKIEKINDDTSSLKLNTDVIATDVGGIRELIRSSSRDSSLVSDGLNKLQRYALNKSDLDEVRTEITQMKNQIAIFCR